MVANEALAAYCPDLDEWPERWRYDDSDVAPGQRIVECFKPYLRHLLSSGLSPTTLRKHRDNLWLLGGEIIRDLWETPKLRKRPVEALIAAALDDDGGPWLSHRQSEAEQRSFDSTCRKLHRFLQGVPDIAQPAPTACRSRKGVKGTVE